MEITTTPKPSVATLGGRKVHVNDGNGLALCGATSYLHLTPTNRPATCAKCAKLAAVVT